MVYLLLYHSYMRVRILLVLIILSIACNQGGKKANDDRAKVITPNAAITSGDYAQLHLAINPQDSVVTGYYEDGTRIRDTGGQQFACIFYIEGKLVDSTAKIRTYFPTDDKHIIAGELHIVSNQKVSIKLQDDPGGCRMTGLRLKDTTEVFTLDKKQTWQAIKYITADRASFYAADNEGSKENAYMIKGDIVYIDKIKSPWLHCTYINAKGDSAENWIRAVDVNTAH